MSTVARKIITNNIKVVVDPAIQQTSLGSASQSSLVIEPPFLMAQAASQAGRVAESTTQVSSILGVGVSSGADTALQQMAIQAAAVNLAPTVMDEYLAVTAGVAISGPASILLSNDSDPDGDALTILRYGQPAHGVLLQNPDGTISYTANASYSGPDSFTYTVSDGQGNETVGTVYLTVQGTGNQAPVVQGESVTVQAGVPATGTAAMLLANDSDPDGDTLSIARYGLPAHGTLTQNPDGTVTYTANANFSGTDSFTYVVSDGQGNESTGIVTLAVTPAANTAPTAVNDSASVVQDGSVTITVLANDTDPERDTLSVSAVGAAANGAATITADGRIIYTPKAGFTGADSFSYTVSDGKGGSSTAQVNVTVQAGAPDMLATADTGISSTDNITANTRPGFTIPAPPAGSVAVLLVDGVEVAATYNATAKSLTPNTAIAEGDHQISYGYKPSAGGALTLTSGALSITIDAVKETPAAVDLAAASDSGGSATDNITNLTKPVFNVGPLPKVGDVVDLYINNVKVASTYDAVAGTLTPVAALAQGTHAVSWTITNAAGVVSAKAPSLSLVVDTTAPTTYLSSYASKLTTATDLGLSNTDGITSNNKPSLSNQALTSSYFSEAGAVGSADLYVDGVKVASVWDKVAGTLTPANALADGPHTLSFSRTDSAGNETTVSTQSYRITVDTSTPVAPTLTPDMLATTDTGISSTDDITSNTRPGFVVGTPLPGGRIDLLVDGVVVAATYTASTKTLTPNVALSEGSHTIAIVNVSAAGAQSAASAALTIDIDAVKETPAAVDLAAASDSGGSATDNITNLTKPVFNVGPLPKVGDVVDLYINNVKVASTYDAVAGTLTPVAALAQGTHAVSWTITNAAGVVSAKAPSLSLVVDTTAPTTYLSSYASKLTAATDLGLSNTDGITSNNKPSLSNQALTTSYFSEAGAVGTADLYVDGVKVASVWDKVAGTLTPVNALADGPHTLSFSRTDSAGNETAVSTQSYRITVDTSTPVAPTLTPDMLATADTGISSTDDITSNTRPGFVVGTPLPGGRIDLLVDGVVVAATYTASTKTLTPNVALSEGSHTIAIVNVSAAGAQSAASAVLTIDIDAVKEAPTAAPDLADASDSGASATDNVTNLTRPAFAVGALPKAGDTANLYVDGVKVASTYDAAAGTLTPNVAFSAATHTVTWSLTNAAGIESVRSTGLSITVDTTAPTTPVALDLQATSDTGTSTTDNITANNLPSFTVGTAAATDRVSLWVDGVEVPATFDLASRTITATQALTDGVHQVSIKVIDAAGNASLASPALKVDIRTQAPLPLGAPDLQAASDTAGSNSDDLTSVNQPVFAVPTAPANCTAVLYVDGLKIGASYDAKALTLKPTGVLSEGNHLITYAWVDSATGAESQLSPPLAIRVAFNPVVAGSEGNDALVAAVDSDETVINRNLGGGVTIDSVQTPSIDQAFVGLGGNDLVEAGDGTDWVDLGATGNNVHSGTGAVVTTANVAQTVLMSEEDWKMVDSFGNFAAGITANSSADGQLISGWSNVANGGWGQDVIKGGVGVDLAYGSFDNDYIDGGAGVDGLRGGNGDDTLIGGAGSDVLRGDDGSDTYYWRGTDKGAAGTPEVDQITDFAALNFAEGGDVLDLRDLLSGEAFGPNGTVGNLASYLEFDTTSTPGSTLIHVSSNGQFSGGNFSAGAEDLTINLNGVNLRSAMDLTAQATDAQVIEELLKRGNLIAGG